MFVLVVINRIILSTFIIAKQKDEIVAWLKWYNNHTKIQMYYNLNEELRHSASEFQAGTEMVH